ncbi:archaellin/type IV pilin N-terminal domain-containing protein [Methanolobus sp. WCC4]|uniref:archaellin/type IV pilin N-terminal domain-containing protein n=1 Tax=Methanolobus sp. WCC4 TaxID=3125784 RepID=UPI0030FA0E07
MKANKVLLVKADTRAQVGIGTLIIFIAMVLVAAVAASVLIQTSGVLQQKAQSTGKQATQEVSSNLVIKSIEGIRGTTCIDSSMANNISLLRIKVGLNAASAPVDMNQVIISISDGTSTNNLLYANNDKTYGSDMKNFSTTNTAAENLEELLGNNQTNPGNNAKYYYTVEKIRDEDGSFSQANPVMNSGDLATVYISAVSDADTVYCTLGHIHVLSYPLDSGLVINPRASVSIVMTPEAGAATTADFITPSSYGTTEEVQLYP